MDAPSAQTARGMPTDHFTKEDRPMLVLSRKKEESVVIGDDVVVKVVEVRGDKVRLGFYAPRDRSIHRHEVWEQLNGKTLADHVKEKRLR